MALRGILRAISEPAKHSHGNHGTGRGPAHGGYRVIVTRSAFGGAIGAAAEELAVR